eukprot:scaffold93128_cov39-Prasinocladus_malaysianus.AAC.1
MTPEHHSGWLAGRVNCRRVGDEANVLEGILDNSYFVWILAGELLLQAGIVQYGGALFKTTPLSGEEWAACVAAGLGTLLVHRLLLRSHLSPAAHIAYKGLQTVFVSCMLPGEKYSIGHVICGTPIG